MPRKINPLPFEESNMQPAESWSLPDWLVGSKPGMLVQRSNPTPASYNVPDALAALGLDKAPEPMASIGNASQIEIPRAPASEPAPINPALKQALLKKIAPSAPPAPTGPTDEQKAQSEYEAGKVNPWLAFASGIGQTLQGKSPDLSWQDAQNKLVYDKTLGKLRLDKKDAEAKRQHDEEMAFKREQLKIQDAQRRDMAKLNAGYREDAKAQKSDERARERMTTFGEARTVEDAKQLKSAAELKTNFDNKLNEMIALREKHGGGATLNREDVSRGKQLSKDLLLAYKDMAKLGVLSVSDMNILNKIIPEDPLAYDFVPGQDPIMSNLKKFKGDTEKDFASRLNQRLQNPPTQVEAPTAENAPQAGDKIEKFMQKNGITDRNEAIKILKQHGRL